METERIKTGLKSVFVKGYLCVISSLLFVWQYKISSSSSSSLDLYIYCRLRMCRDSDGASPPTADTSDDDDQTLRRKRDVNMLAMTSRSTASGPQGVTQASTARRTADGTVNSWSANIRTCIYFLLSYFIALCDWLKSRSFAVCDPTAWISLPAAWTRIFVIILFLEDYLKTELIAGRMAFWR